MVDRGPQRREPQPLDTITTSCPSASSTGQPVPNGPRTPSDVACFSLVSAPLTSADIADRMHVAAHVGGVAAHRDGHSPTPKT